MAQTTPDDTLALLTRLSQKPGVQSTLVLSRDTGAIVRTSGLTSNSISANPNSTQPSSSEDSTELLSNGAGRQATGIHSAEDVARLVYHFVGAAGSMIHELDESDEAKLVRVRTKKNELVIVPDAKFLLVVIHETPPA
ncbi:hypothetical protein EV356DRAFT_529727 [Viridothelium virens]|uniref:Roadblock/LAMTOR2 domain-containing protein n=1 Tax=Viridothelium virens TaxID=1048519 RepID=A0A6A6HJ14_VIRVR|nr:hypothetical protein EV356DRAFT_529727 [Viridothelium virens]